MIDTKKIKMMNNKILFKKEEIKSDVALPNNSKTQKKLEWGRVINAEDESLIGKLILWDPYASQELLIGSESYMTTRKEAIVMVAEEA